jgi:hypothetical protein
MIRSLMIAAASAAVLRKGRTITESQSAVLRQSDSGHQARAMLAKAVGRVLAAALFLVASISARAAIWELPLGPYGVFRLDVPSGWTAGPRGRGIAITPPQGVPLILLISPIPSPKFPLVDTLSEVDVRRVVAGLQNSAEEPALEAIWFEGPKSRGFFVSATDKTVTQPTAQNFKYVTQGVLVTGRISVVFTILTNLSSGPERDRAGEIVRSAWHEPAPIPVDAAGPAPFTPGGPFTFTVPESRVIVKVSDPSLGPENAPSGRPGYFILRRHDPQFILSPSWVSGWLEPASSYKGLKEFWQSESRSPAPSRRPGSRCSGLVRGRWLPSTCRCQAAAPVPTCVQSASRPGLGSTCTSPQLRQGRLPRSVRNCSPHWAGSR